MNMTAVSMESTSADEHPPLDVCLSNVRSCDVYIGVFGFRYGFIPPGCTQSITELEYRAAGETGIPRLVFVAESHQWDLAFVDAMTGDGERGERIKQLRAELESTKTVAYFTTPDILAAKVASALHDWADRLREAKPAPQRARQTVDAYLEDCISRVAELEGRYVHLSGTATRMSPIDIPAQLVPRSFRVLATRQTDATQDEVLVSIAKVVERYPQVVLVGEPGSGKSTTLLYMYLSEAKRALDSAGRVPLMVNLAEWPESIPDLKTLLVHEREVRGCPSIPASECVLLLDGLNELSEQHYAARVSSIQKWIDENPAAQVVLTSREQQYLQGKRLRIPTVTIHPLSDPQIEEFIRNYLGESDAAGLLDGIGWDSRGPMNRRHLSRLAQNPFQLMLMCFVYKNEKRLPSTRGELLRLLTQTLHQREVDHYRDGGLSYEEIQAGLGELALSAVQARSATAIEESWAVKNMPDGLDYTAVRALGVNMGLLRSSKKDRYIQFMHQLLLEYFAAERLVAAPKRMEKILRPPRFQNRSRRAQACDEVCATFTELVDDSATALNAVARIDPYLAVDILSQSNRASEIDTATCVSFARALLRFHDADRAALITRLRTLGVAALVPLRELLASSSKAERRLAVESLAGIENPEAIQELSVALKDSNRWVRREAQAAIRRLAERRPDIAAEFLRDKLPSHDPDGSDELVMLLAPSVAEEPMEEGFDSRAYLPVELQDVTPSAPAHMPVLLVRENNLAKVLDVAETYLRVRTAAARGQQQGADAILVTSSPEPDRTVTPGEPADTLADPGADEVPDLLAEIESPTVALRCRALRTLAHIRDPRLVEPVKPLVNDRDKDVAFHALQVLASQCDEALVPLLAEFADSWSARTRKVALRGLLQCGPPGLKVVLGYLRDSSLVTRIEVVRQLGSNGVMVDSGMIVPLLSDASGTLRHAALMWLLQVEPMRAFDELLLLVEGRQRSDRAFAIAPIADLFAQISGRGCVIGTRAVLREQDVAPVSAAIRVRRIDIGIRIAACIHDATRKDIWRPASLMLYLLFEDDHDLLRFVLDSAAARETVTADRVPPPATNMDVA
jgi:HEAT repeat protein